MSELLFDRNQTGAAIKQVSRQRVPHKVRIDPTLAKLTPRNRSQDLADVAGR